VLRARALLAVAEEVVRGLTSLRRTDLATSVVKEAEHRASTCMDCELETVALYAAAADLNIADGNQREALRYQTLRAEALTRNETGKARLAVEQARQRAEFQQQQSEMAQELDQERAQARTMDIEHRMQRINLVVMIGFIILFAGVLFVRARTLRRMQVEQLRTRLSRDLHDDIGSTLSSINILSSVARRKAEAGDDGRRGGFPGRHQRHARQRLMRNMSDIVWSVDPDKDTLEELLVRMREFGAAVLEPKGHHLPVRKHRYADRNITAHLEEQPLPHLQRSGEQRGEACPGHGGRGFVQHANSRLRMTIADDGKGLESNTVGAGVIGGNGLAQHAGACRGDEG
jgi:hypothetical protein